LAGDYHFHLALDKISRECGEPQLLTFGEVILDDRILAFDKAGFTETIVEIGEAGSNIGERAGMEKTDHRQRRLMRPRYYRPRRRAPQSGNYLTTIH
jgi:hypothetical protein